MRHRLLPAFALALILVTPLLRAESIVPQRENVRYEYARVLQVSPVYQTLTAASQERRCDDDSKLQRVVGAVRNALKHDRTPADANCHVVRVDHEFQRTIAYDVDYTIRGVKYRSRLPEDPGHLLRIRVSVTPAP